MPEPACSSCCERAFFNEMRFAMQKNSGSKLRPVVVAVATAFVAASSILLSAAQMGSPAVSGYGIAAPAD